MPITEREKHKNNILIYLILLTIMKRKDYQSPTMTVVQLKHRSQILAGSQVQATMDDEWEEEDL